jgi:hypothetical protein
VEWRDTWFGTKEPIGEAADEADPNGNNVPNLMEYALGGDPLSASELISFDSAGLWFPSPPTDTDAILEVATSSDLKTWKVAARFNAGQPQELLLPDFELILAEDEPGYLLFRLKENTDFETMFFKLHTELR